MDNETYHKAMSILEDLSALVDKAISQLKEIELEESK